MEGRMEGRRREGDNEGFGNVGMTLGTRTVI